MAAGEEFMPCSRLVYADLSAGRIELWLTTVKNHGFFFRYSGSLFEIPLQGNLSLHAQRNAGSPIWPGKSSPE